MRFDIKIIVAAKSTQDIERFYRNNPTLFVYDNLVLFILPANVCPFGISIITKSISENINFVFQDNTGIYDALNKGILLSSREYYLVAGCDDVIFFDNILNLNLCDYAVITGIVKTTVGAMRPKNNLLKYLHKSKISEHSVGCIIKTSLHYKYGLYDTKYHIASDAKFILKLIFAKERFRFYDVEFGAYSLGGLSSTNKLKAYRETIYFLSEIDCSLLIKLILISITFLRCLKSFIC